MGETVIPMVRRALLNQIDVLAGSAAEELQRRGLGPHAAMERLATLVAESRHQPDPNYVEPSDAALEAAFEKYGIEGAIDAFTHRLRKVRPRQRREERLAAALGRLINGS